MKKWVVRFASLYVFNVVVLLLLGFFLGSVRVGWAAFWAAVILTAATIWLKPAITALFRKRVARTVSRRTKVGEKLVQYGLVLTVAVIVWVTVVLLSSVRVTGFLWGWIIPPIALLIAWAIYDALDDRIETRAGALYDRALGGRADAAPSVTPPPAAPATARDRDREVSDGLTPEQRRMLDELG